MQPLTPEQSALAARHYPLIELATRQLARQIPRADPDAVLSDGALGLVYAARTYRAERRASFKTWATSCIRWAVLDGVRAQIGREPGEGQRHRKRRVFGLSDALARNAPARTPPPDEAAMIADEDRHYRAGLVRRAEKAMRQLNGNHVRRRMLGLALHGATQREIALVMGMREPGVQKQLACLAGTIADIRREP